MTAQGAMLACLLAGFVAVSLQGCSVMTGTTTMDDGTIKCEGDDAADVGNCVASKKFAAGYAAGSDNEGDKSDCDAQQTLINCLSKCPAGSWESSLDEFKPLNNGTQLTMMAFATMVQKGADGCTGLTQPFDGSSCDDGSCSEAYLELSYCYEDAAEVPLTFAECMDCMGELNEDRMWCCGGGKVDDYTACEAEFMACGSWEVRELSCEEAIVVAR